GLIGAFTTFSTWAFESHRLGEEGELRFGVMNFALSLVLGVTAAWVGRHVGGWL
ncbi:MAG: CrcB family protein, partial [Solirubrobacterales bacterium]|nr:CrcB family protein [Solirubrobacterales bacterium]